MKSRKAGKKPRKSGEHIGSRPTRGAPRQQQAAGGKAKKGKR